MALAQELPQPIPVEAKEPWAAAIVMIVAALMDMVDGSIVNVALPTIRRSLFASPTEIEWIVSGYMLAFAAVLIPAGRLGDRVGRRRLFLVGVTVFGAMSLLCGVSASATELIICRVIQGAAAGVLVPQVLASFRALFTQRSRARAFGVYGAIAGLGTVVGVVLGGALTQANLLGWSWRTVFLVNVPIAAAALIAGILTVPDSRDASRKDFDLLGALILSASLVAIVYPLLEGRENGWPGWGFALMASGAAGVAALGLVERGRSHQSVAPLINVRQFSIPAFSAGVAVQLCFSLALQGWALVLILWLQAGHGFSPLHAGLTLLAFSVGAIITAPQAGTLALRHGRRILMVGAVLMVVGTVGAALPTWIAPSSISSWILVPGLVVAGAGLGLLVVPLVNVVLAAVPSGDAGGASGIFSTAQQLGGAIGVAILGTVFFGNLGVDHFDAAFEAAVPIAAGSLLACFLLCFLLPNDAVTEEAVAEAA